MVRALAARRTEPQRARGRARQDSRDNCHALFASGCLSPKTRRAYRRHVFAVATASRRCVGVAQSALNRALARNKRHSRERDSIGTLPENATRHGYRSCATGPGLIEALGDFSASVVGVAANARGTFVFFATSASERTRVDVHAVGAHYLIAQRTIRIRKPGLHDENVFF